MINNGVVQMKVQLDTIQAKQSVSEIRDICEGLANVVNQIGSEIKKALSIDTGELVDMQEGFQSVTGSLDDVSAKVEEIVSLMAKPETSWIDSFISGLEGFNELSDGLGNVENFSESISEGLEKADKSFNILKAILPDSCDLVGELGMRMKNALGSIDLSGITSKFSALGTKIAEMGSAIGSNLSGMFGTITSAMSGMSPVQGPEIHRHRMLKERRIPICRTASILNVGASIARLRALKKGELVKRLRIMNKL